MSETPNVPTQDAAAPQAPPVDEPPPIEEIITDELVRSIVQAKDENLDLVDFTASIGSQIGDNYMSIMYAATINVKSKTTAEPSSFDVMIKTIPRNAFRRQMINECKAFEKEAKIYSDVLADFHKFQQERGLEEHEIFKAYPICYKSHVDNETDYIVLEDLRPKGFKMANRIIGLDESHCEIVLRNMAKFHAVSFAMFEGDYDKIREKYPFLEETMFKPPEEINEMQKMYFPQTFKMEGGELRKAGLDAEAARVEGIFDGDQFFTRMNKMTGQKVPNAVINHGDSWVNNFLFKYDEETGKPKDLKLIDFQISRCSSRSVDLNYFMYTSPQLNILNDKEEQLLRLYHDEFTSFCKKLGYINEDLTFQALQEEFNHVRPYGITLGLMLCPMMGANKDDVPDLEKMNFDPNSENLQEATEEFFNSFMKNGSILTKLRNFAEIHIPKCPNEWEQQ